MNSLTDTDKPKAYSINNTMTLKGNQDLEKHSGMGSVIIGVKLKWQKALWNNKESQWSSWPTIRGESSSAGGVRLCFWRTGVCLRH